MQILSYFDFPSQGNKWLKLYSNPLCIHDGAVILESFCQSFRIIKLHVTKSLKTVRFFVIHKSYISCLYNSMVSK